MRPPGWSAFDRTAVTELRNARHAPDAPCPFIGHDHRLSWVSEGYKRGTEYHGDPLVSFRVSPTYVLKNHLDNFITGHELIEQLTGKAETWRLGNENSEDALSFNVFRSFQETGLLRQVAGVLVGLELEEEPELIVWGHRLGGGSAAPDDDLKAVLNEIEGTRGQQTEPDVILRLPGWGWIFIEAKLSSPTSTYKGRPDRLASWRNRYGNSEAFNATSLAAAEADAFPEQLLRNVAVAHRLAGGKNAAVVALVRDVYHDSVTGWAAEFVADDRVLTRTATWEQLYALTADKAELTDLRDYLGDKSVGLRPAFKLHSA
jgi:hypothetical protein